MGPSNHLSLGLSGLMILLTGLTELIPTTRSPAISTVANKAMEHPSRCFYKLGGSVFRCLHKKSPTIWVLY